MSLVSVGTGAKCINNVESVENWGENMKPNQTIPTSYTEIRNRPIYIILLSSLVPHVTQHILKGCFLTS